MFYTSLLCAYGIVNHPVVYGVADIQFVAGLNKIYLNIVFFFYDCSKNICNFSDNIRTNANTSIFNSIYKKIQKPATPGSVADVHNVAALSNEVKVTNSKALLTCLT